ncbi:MULTISPECIES: YpzG family protein [Terribacillus]|uniref:YpzG family protein n=1 Tax=Terribacillus TaxID=459532 RepID=UPI000985773B|nr:MULTISPECIES: YpzG family protein [Terribacillus]QXE02522.1 YpzG family protein [Terribacillus sp. DMT04]
MSKFDRFSKYGTINSIIQSPRSSAKHANNQVNGETRRTQTDMIVATQSTKNNRK